MKYRREIDGLRALAVVPVILFHAGFQAFSGGFVGVDVFFVISGYLITSVIVAEKQAGAFTLLKFYERRARRILPALFVVMAACLPFAWFWFLPIDMKDFSQSLVAVNGFVSNLLFAYKSDYFDTANELKPLLHTWSLAVEEQYYVLFPIFLLLTWRLGKRWTVALLAVLAFISLGTAQWASQAHPTLAFFLLPTRGWEILLGAFIAYYNDRDENKKVASNVAQFASLFGLSLVVYAVFCFDKQTPFPSLYTLLPTVGASLLILFATQQTMVGKLLGSKIVVGVGLISYSAYLWHQPLLVFARYRSLEQPTNWLLAMLSVAVVALSILSWRFVEIPFRNRQQFSCHQIFKYAFFCSFVFVIIGLAGHFNIGFPKRVAPSNLPKNYFELGTMTRIDLKGIDGNLCVSDIASICQIKTDPGAKSILLVGDSHSADYSFEFRQYLTNHKVNAWQFSIGGCEFLPSQSERNNGECGKARVLLESVIKKKKFDKILFVSSLYGHTDRSESMILQEDIRSLSSLIDAMLESKSDVIFFTPRYTLSTEPMRAALLNKLDDIHIVKEPFSDYIDEKIDLLKSNDHFTIFNERDYLIRLGCGDVKCFNGHTPSLQPLYRDTNHLTPFGTKLVVQRLIEAQVL